MTIKRTSRIGKADIFASTVEEVGQVAAPVVELQPVQPTPQPQAKLGRPPVHTDTWSKITVVLFDRQVVFLDRAAVAVRERTGKAISRAEIIRALIDGLEASDLDIASATTEAELKALVVDRLSAR